MMENKINLPPFYVGQRVVAVVDTENLVKGNEYVISRIIGRECGCWSVEVGIKRLPVTKNCTCVHGIKRPGSDWFNAKRFAPIQQTFQSISFEKVIEKEAPLIGVN